MEEIVAGPLPIWPSHFDDVPACGLCRDEGSVPGVGGPCPYGCGADDRTRIYGGAA